MFKDRKDAAQQLAKALEKYKDTGAIVLGIPRGGAETAYYVAKHLHADLSLLVARKLGHPTNPEYAVGAIAEDGSVYLNPEAQSGLSNEMIAKLKEQQQKEIVRRVQALRQGEPLPALKGKTVLLVDDGIATGSTVFAAIRMCRHMGAARIVVAAPVSGRDKKRELLDEADEVVILETPDFYTGVSQVYYNFYNLTDEEALEFMNQWKKEIP
ncbi:phosphoribosyltransferase [Pontibacter mangrovi]|uniref:Phosphoribosyltransferase n=2 Tax=Pontibacter mangrovi TaxID=2589816 RepID=A0A501WGH7_9BACT|nr:phosphoribosyltransferase family protein [Pontibacter mangrovi]TPE46261.1 phosphoribosyltransferase [Pontibacter mangrovi]